MTTSISAYCNWFFTLIDCSFFRVNRKGVGGHEEEISIGFSVLSFGVSRLSFYLFHFQIDGIDVFHSTWEITVCNLTKRFRVGKKVGSVRKMKKVKFKLKDGM